MDGRLKVTGQARYAAEAKPPGLVYAATVDATIPAGTIRSIDTSAAERAPGVLLVLTHLSSDKLPYLSAEERPAVDPVAGEQLRVLHDARVSFAGEPVAVVVAVSQLLAEHAASLVRVLYTRDPAPRMRFAAELGQPTSPAAQKKGRGPESRQGDAEGAWAAAPVRLEAGYFQAREQHNPMEPHATVAHWEGDQLTVWSKTQWVGNERDEISRRFGVSPDKVRVVSPFVGGAFGSALRTWPHVTLAVMAARRVGRPVRLELTRRQLFTQVGFRGASHQRVALGAEADGRLTALTQELVGQTSTYEEFAEPALGPAASTYACANRLTRYRLVAMNVSTPCPMRGPGWATGLIGQEIAMDEMAVLLKMDPVELRLRNYAERDPKKQLPWSSKALRSCYAQGAERFGWARRNPAPRSMRAGRDLVGYGMATAIYTATRYPAKASATLVVDGSVVVRCATSDMGPGTYTSMTQVAADALDVPLERVRFELGDSAFPEAKEHGGSTTLASVGSAVAAACVELRRKRDELRAAHSSDSGSDADLLRHAGIERLEAKGESAPGEEAKTHAMNGFGAVFVEVRVDADLGTVRVPRVIGAYDAGRIVNPKLARSQCIGAMAGGIGMALLEEASWDETLGRIANASLAEYLVPVSADIHELDAIFVDSEDTVMNPLGVKGVAELGLCGVAPAIANAVWHATGERVRELPILPERLLLPG